MKVDIVAKRLEEVPADALIVGLYVGETKLPERLARLDRAAQGQLKRVLDAEKFSGKAGHVTHAHADGRRIVVAGLGARTETTSEVLRRAAAAGVRRARDLGARTVAVEVLGDRLTARQRAQAVVEGAILGTYHFDRYKREKADKTVDELRLVEPDARRAREARDGMRRGESFALATSFARDLINAPANELHPTDLARAATELGKESRLDVKVYDAAECRKMGMGAFLGVAAGSEQPPKFIHVTYSPSGRPAAGRKRKKVVLIGKGITFDSGGLDLKPPDGMLRMKYDMAGAAAVLGIMGALPQLRSPVEVHGLIAATENMPSGTALRPGDVLRAMNGTTIEVGNTDAEGRLTLADALSYAAARVKPDEVIDLATLTGACVVALGPHIAGVMGNDDPLTARWLQAAKEAGEEMWHLPLPPRLVEQLKSEIADLKNTAERWGGALTAGLFLKEFLDATPWVHVDLAGPASTDKELGHVGKGGTGFGVATILQFVRSLAA